MRRLLLDLSTLARWTGPPTGMIRVEHEIHAASSAAPDVVPVFYDPVMRAYRRLAPRFAGMLLGLDAALDGWGTDYHVVRPGWRRLVPSRYPLVRALARRRLLAPDGRSRRLHAAIERALLRMRAHGLPLTESGLAGIVPRELALAEPVTPTEQDVVLAPSSDWLHKDLGQLAEQKAATGFRMAVVCYDVIPLLFPQYFPQPDVTAFEAYWRRMFGLADLVIVNSRAVRHDVEAWCAREGIAQPRLDVIPLGVPQPARGAATALPQGLSEGRFAMFVSTIEPRKNHALLLDAWAELLARGVPQRAQFKLVFVGRAGWMVQEVMARLARAAAWQGTLLHLEGVSDEMLEALYRAAAFCLYPSRYEGFGLPVIEALARGTPVIASSGGALAELGSLVPTLPPADLPAWRDLIADWIADPAVRRLPPQAELGKLAAGPDVARRMLAAARDLVHGESSGGAQNAAGG